MCYHVSVRSAGIRAGAPSRSSNARERLSNHVAQPLYRNSYWLIVSNGLGAATGFVFWLLAARLATAAEVGQAAGLFSAVLFLSYLTSLGLPYGVLRFAGVGDDLSAVINTGLFVSALTSVIASLAFVAGARLWAPELTGPLSGLGAVLIFATLNAASGVATLLDAIATGQRSAQHVALRRLLGVTKLPLLLLLAASGAVGIYTASLLPVVVGSVASVAALPWMVRGYRRTFTASAGIVRRFFTFSLETFPASLLSGAPPFILPLFALGILGPVNTAYFYIAWSVASVLMLIPTFIAQVSLSEGSRGDLTTVARRSRRFALGLVLPAVACVVVLAGPVLRLYGQEYAAHGTHALQVLAMSAIPWAVVAIKLSVLRAAERAREVLLLSAIFALGSLAAAGGLGTVLGLPGLAIGWTAGVSAAAVLSTQVGARSAAGRRASQVDGRKAAHIIDRRHNRH